MSKRLNDIRRVILALCFFGLVLSLLGTELPWVKIHQSSPQNPLYILDSSICEKTSTITTLKFTLDVYLTLTTAQICQTFTSGILPSYIGGASLKDIRMCTDAGYHQLSNFMEDTNTWESYVSQCSSVGSATFALIIVSLVIIGITMIINTFPDIVQRCCSDQYSFKNKFIRSLTALLAPVCVTLSIIIYGTKCLNGDIDDVLKEQKMTRTGSSGYSLCIVSCVILWIYWTLFVYRMWCDNNVKINGKDMTATFLDKTQGRKGTDVDTGMIDESQEQRETVMSQSGVYDEYREQPQDDANVKYEDNSKISAYEDDTSGGPSAGAWKDVEED